MNTFKVGDVVRYVLAGRIGWETEDWAARAGCILGKEYTVRGAYDLRIQVEGMGNPVGRMYNIHPDHFELAKNSIKYKPNCIQIPAKRRIKNV